VPHDPPPSPDEILRAIRANTPTCNCTPTIVIRHHTWRRTRVQAHHQPGCPVVGHHQQIRLDDQ
jgi:hypothetical protein